MQDEVFKFRIAGMPVKNPVRGFYMKLDVACQNNVSGPDFRVKEIGAGIVVPLPEIQDFHLISFHIPKIKILKNLEIPQILQEFFVHFLKAKGTNV